MYRRNQAPVSVFCRLLRTYARVKVPDGSLVFAQTGVRTNWFGKCSEHRCKGFRPVSGGNRDLEGALLRKSSPGFIGAGRDPIAEKVRRRARTVAEAGPSAGVPPAALPLEVNPDRGGTGQGRDDPQAPAAGPATADAGGKHADEQGRLPQAMGAGRSARIAVHRHAATKS